MKSVLNPVLLTLLSNMLLSACVSMSGIANSLSDAVLNQNDPEIVKDGAPTFMIMVDSFIERDPQDAPLLLAGSKLYGAYASAFVTDRERAKRLSNKAHAYAKRAFCERVIELCRATRLTLDEYKVALSKFDNRKELAYLYVFATTWAGVIQTHTDDWSAIADLPKVEASIQKVVEMDNEYDHGNAHLYLAVINTQLPESLGGKPEIGRKHFEKAIAISKNQNLMVNVLFAKNYARLVFDKNLHDHLLNRVISANAEASGFTLINMLAKREAKKLLEESNEYF